MPPKKPEYITRNEFHKRIMDTDSVIKEFRQMQISRASDKVVDTACHEEIKIKLVALQTDVLGIHTILNTVSANGTKGLENSLRDIYSKISELTEITKASRTDVKMVNAWREWKNGKTWRRMFFSTKSYVAIIMAFFTLHKLTIGSQSILTIIIDFFIK
jgi:hypothetical protein